MTIQKNILEDPGSFGTGDEVVDLLAPSATADAVKDDDVFGAFPYTSEFERSQVAVDTTRRTQGAKSL